MSEELKRIEAQHDPDNPDSNAVCLGDSHAEEPDYPCDVVKLARALDEAPSIALGMTGPGNTLQQSQGYSDACRDIFDALKAHKQKALREVAK